MVSVIRKQFSNLQILLKTEINFCSFFLETPGTGSRNVPNYVKSEGKSCLK